MEAIKLGAKVRDRITGFVGIAVMRSDYINGCVRYGVQGPMDKDGKIPEAYYVDEQQCEVLEEAVHEPAEAKRGGPAQYTPRNA
jgi:hypothetical protein